MNILAIGGSAGSLPVVRLITATLTSEMNSAVFITIHAPSDKKSQLPRILNRSNGLPAIHATNNLPIEPNNIYVAPPGFHLVIQKSRILLSDDAKENGFRPSIDVMFRSAAVSYGPAVTGIILSGLLDDGAAGMAAIKKLGGTSIVQHPNDAEFDSMPLSVLKATDADYCVPAPEIPLVLKAISRSNKKPLPMKNDPTITWENSFAEGRRYPVTDITSHATSTRHICPLCAGPLFKIKDDSVHRYRCFTGHAYSAESLIHEMNGKMEHLAWDLYRTLDEKKEILHRLFPESNILKKEVESINKQLEVLEQLRKSIERDGHEGPQP